MIRTKLAKKVLTKAEQKHLTCDAGISSMAAMRSQIDFMKNTEPDFPARICFDCWGIARKLKIIGEVKP